MKLIPKYLKGKKTEYKPDWSDKAEPWASGFGLTADAVAMYLASSGVGAVPAAIVGTIGNTPNLVIDGWQTGRDWYRWYKDDAPIEDALWNTGELGLDLLGAKYAAKAMKAANKASHEGLVINEVNKLVKKNGRAKSREVMEIYDDIKRRELGNIFLAKLLANAPTNIYHGKDLFIAPLDNTRNVKKVNLNK